MKTETTTRWVIRELEIDRDGKALNTYDYGYKKDEYRLAQRTFVAFKNAWPSIKFMFLEQTITTTTIEKEVQIRGLK